MTDDVLNSLKNILETLTGDISPEKKVAMEKAGIEACPQCNNYPPHREWCGACDQKGFRKIKNASGL